MQRIDSKQRKEKEERIVFVSASILFVLLWCGILVNHFWNKVKTRQAESSTTLQLIEQLHDGSALVRRVSAQELGGRSDTNAVMPLIDISDDENEEVRAAVAQALGMLGDTRAIDPLCKMLRDPEATVQMYAMPAIASIGKSIEHECMMTLVGLTNSENKFIRAAAVQALSRVGDGECVRALIERLDDSSWKVRCTAIEALASVGDARCVPLLIEQLDAERNHWAKSLFSDDPRTTAHAAKEALLALGCTSDETVKQLVRYVADGEAGTRTKLHIVDILGQSGNANSVEAFISILDGSRDYEKYIDKDLDSLYMACARHLVAFDEPAGLEFLWNTILFPQRETASAYAVAALKKIEAYPSTEMLWEVVTRTGETNVLERILSLLLSRDAFDPETIVRETRQIEDRGQTANIRFSFANKNKAIWQSNNEEILIRLDEDQEERFFRDNSWLKDSVDDVLDMFLPPIIGSGGVPGDIEVSIACTNTIRFAHKRSSGGQIIKMHVLQYLNTRTAVDVGIADRRNSESLRGAFESTSTSVSDLQRDIVDFLFESLTKILVLDSVSEEQLLRKAFYFGRSYGTPLALHPDSIDSFIDQLRYTAARSVPSINFIHTEFCVLLGCYWSRF